MSSALAEAAAPERSTASTADESAAPQSNSSACRYTTQTIQEAQRPIASQAWEGGAGELEVLYETMRGHLQRQHAT